jgi:hypothetical protein
MQTSLFPMGSRRNAWLRRKTVRLETAIRFTSPAVRGRPPGPREADAAGRNRRAHGVVLRRQKES